MKYIVMECHLSYAVVLDEAGRFLKVANIHYEVGQTVTKVCEMKPPQAAEQHGIGIPKKWVYSLTSLAACLLLVFTVLFQVGQTTIGSVYLSINPEVRIDVNRNDKVVAMEGLNPDGYDLMENYAFKKKPLELVLDELVDLAIEKGYLHPGGTITLTLDAENDAWITERSDTLREHLEDHLGEAMAVTVETKTKDTTKETKENITITIPVDGGSPDDPAATRKETPSKGNATPPPPTDAGAQEPPADNGNSDYGDITNGNSGYNASDGGNSNYNGQSGDSSTDDD